MSATRFTTVDDPVLGERVLCATARNGAPVRLLPTDRFREVSAVVTFGYGSTDLGYRRADGSLHRSPLGVAHFLEHELFEDEDLHVFERFGRRGARVNAMTGFARTTYYVQCSRDTDDNLADLLRLVARAHLSDARVTKERGIIAQELRMYEDGPEYRGFFALLAALWGEHPVRHPVGGTVESIGAIDVAELEACYRAFYRAGNCGIAIAGPIDPERVLDALDEWPLAHGEAPARHCPADLGPPPQRRVDLAMAVARPRLLLGWKEGTLLTDVEARAMRELETRVLLDRLLGPASELRETLAARGVIDDSLSISYLSEPTFGVGVVACETDDPAATEAALRGLLETPIAVDDEQIERVRRKQLGGYVRSLDAVQSMAFGLAEEALEGVPPFRAIPRMAAVTRQRVEARQRELFVPASSATVVVRSATS